MKRKTILSMLLAVAIGGLPLTAAQEPDDKEKPKQEQPKKQPPPPKPEPRQEPAPPPKQQKPEGKQRPPSEKERQKPQKEQDQEKAKQDRRSTEQTAKTESRKGAEGKGVKIPPEKFRTSFGREHHFRVTRRDDRRFQYGGYRFEVVEVWPAGWSFDDDCYIEEDRDDYYLVDVFRPEIRVLVIVVQG
jgi:hypothetical protein